MDFPPFGNRGGDKFFREILAKRIGQADMRDKTAAEKSAVPLGGSVDELIGNHNVAGGDLLSQTANSAYRNDSIDSQFLHGKDIGAKVDLRRQPTMALAMAWQES